jgi:hypothetical protein
MRKKKASGRGKRSSRLRKLHILIGRSTKTQTIEPAPVERPALASTGSANADHEMVQYLVDLPVRLAEVTIDAGALLSGTAERYPHRALKRNLISSVWSMSDQMDEKKSKETILFSECSNDTADCCTRAHRILAGRHILRCAAVACHSSVKSCSSQVVMK